MNDETEKVLGSEEEVAKLRERYERRSGKTSLESVERDLAEVRERLEKTTVALRVADAAVVSLKRDNLRLERALGKLVGATEIQLVSREVVVPPEPQQSTGVVDVGPHPHLKHALGVDPPRQSLPHPTPETPRGTRVVLLDEPLEGQEDGCGYFEEWSDVGTSRTAIVLLYSGERVRLDPTTLGVLEAK